MSLTIFNSNDPRLDDLKRQFVSLERELGNIQLAYTTLKGQHGQKCAQSLKDSLSSLLDVVKYVNKADKALIYWVEKGGAMKLALRCIGVDKRTQAIAKRKTKKIQNQVSSVENCFSQTSEVFMDSLKAVQNLNVTVTQYSLSTLGDAQQQANTLSDDLDSNVQAIQMKLENTCLERTSVQEEIDIIPSRISTVKSQQSNAQNASDSNAVASFAGFATAGLAIGASFFFPPLAIVALPATGLGIGSAVISSNYTSQVETLQRREGDLRSQLDTLRTQIESLEQTIPELDRQRNSFASTKNSVSALQDRCAGLRCESQLILDELLQARIVLSTIKMKTEAIASQLSECGYARTRREIGGKLREIIKGIQIAGKSKAIQYDDDRITDALGKLMRIEGRTHNVLLIMSS